MGTGAFARPAGRSPAIEKDPSTAQHITPMSIIDSPMVLSTSTRTRSLFGAHPQAITYSCTRNSSPYTKISAPRKIVVRAISADGTSFRHSFSVTSANEIPARNRNSGAGNVPPSCEYIKKRLCLACGLSQES